MTTKQNRINSHPDMAIKLLHTSDWHLGHKLHDFDRGEEQAFFLDRLLETLEREAIDVLLVSGDVFDVSNPSAAAQEMLYSFVSRASRLLPGLQIVVTAGNHDSPARLEAPAALTDPMDIIFRGNVGRTAEREPDYAPLIIPLCSRRAKLEALRADKEAPIEAVCLAVPYLHESDLPKPEGDERGLNASTALFYRQALEQARRRYGATIPVVAMGHLYVGGASVSDSERGVRVGNLDCVAASAFPEELAYVALGHIHKAQRIGGNDRIRYCGTPLPMSMSEADYKHQFVVVTLDGDSAEVSLIEIPQHTAMHRLGTAQKPVAREELLGRLAELVDTIADDNRPPYLELHVALTEPDVTLQREVKEFLADKAVRLTSILAHYPNRSDEKRRAVSNIEELQRLTPQEIFENYYQSKFADTQLSEQVRSLFDEVVDQCLNPKS
jgi:exonuclease SbcD